MLTTTVMRNRGMWACRLSRHPLGALRCPSRVVLSSGEDAMGDYPIWRLTADQAEEAGALLAHVFVDDPLFVAVDTK